MKHEKIILRDNGLRVKIVAELFTTPWGSNQSISNYVLTCAKGENNWTLVKDDPVREYLRMSVDEYKKHGRKAMFYLVSTSEILKTNQELLVNYESGIHAASSRLQLLRANRKSLDS